MWVDVGLVDDVKLQVSLYINQLMYGIDGYIYGFQFVLNVGFQLIRLCYIYLVKGLFLVFVVSCLWWVIDCKGDGVLCLQLFKLGVIRKSYFLGNKKGLILLWVNFLFFILVLRINEVKLFVIVFIIGFFF